MVCPWLIKTVTDTDNKNSYNNTKRVEHQEFDRCMGYQCPFYKELHGNDKEGAYTVPVCTRAAQFNK